MPDINTYLSNKISDADRSKLRPLLKHSLKLNLYGFLIELNFAYLDDLTHYDYYFKYFVEQSFDINTQVKTIWTADFGYQSFSKALENPEYLKAIHIVVGEEIFLYDSFREKPSKPSLIPPLHLNPFDNQHIGFHGAALVRDHKSILIFGKNNSGKSTCSVNLIWDGYKLLSDDLIIYNFINNKILAFPRPIGLREGTIIAYPEIKKALINKQLIRYKAVDYTHLMISPELLVPGCLADSATPSVAIFLRPISGINQIIIHKVDKSSLIKLLKVFSYSSNLNPKKHDKKVQILANNIDASYIVSFDIKLLNMNDLIQIIDNFLVIALTQ
jgi:hypothetical protein